MTPSARVNQYCFFGFGMRLILFADSRSSFFTPSSGGAEEQGNCAFLCSSA
jgi:hypothetical protein